MTGDEVQIENGEYTRVANAILETLAKTRLNGQEFRALMFLFRKTYGWNKKEDSISLSQWQVGLDLTHRQHVIPILDGLINKKIIYRDRKIGLVWIYGFNKYFDQWETGVTQESNRDGVTQQGNRGVTLQGNGVLPNQVTEVLPSRVTTKDIKHTKTKDKLKTIPAKAGQPKGDPKILFELARTLSLITKMDFDKNQGRLFKEAKYYKPDDVAKLHSDYDLGGQWYFCDWRGQKGQSPTLAQVRESWGNLVPPSNGKNGNGHIPPVEEDPIERAKIDAVFMEKRK
jgi:phage replication O-like protein O